MDQDDTLILFFMCCHPALTPSSAIALTLRAVGGLTTARNCARIPGSRGDYGAAHQPRQAKHQGLGRPFRLPTPQEQAQRLRSVLHVLYLIFNEGYTSSSGPQLQRLELSREAIRLTRAIHALLPTTPKSRDCWR